MYITVRDLINSYAANNMSEVDVAKFQSQLPVLAAEDVHSMNEYPNVGFLALEIADSKKRSLSLISQYWNLCSLIIMMYGKLPDHLIAISQNMDLFSEYLNRFEFYLKLKIAELEDSSVSN